MSTRVTLLPKVRSELITDSANGEECAFRFPMICSFDPATTVWCHLPGIGKGISTKVSDLHGAYGCSLCHDLVDGRMKQPNHLGDAAILEIMLRALAESQARLLESGLIVVPDGRIL